jgi:hypothetical protein
MPLGQLIDDVVGEGQEFDGTLIDVEALKAQHDVVSTLPTTSC